MSTPPPRYGLLIAGAMSALGFLVLTSLGIEFPGRFLVKAFPIPMLGLWLILTRPNNFTTRILIGLVFSAAGDILLELGPESLFLYGLGAFALAHLSYFWAFSYRFRLDPRRYGIAAIIIVIAILVYVSISDSINELAGPVIVYVGIITLMAVTAAVRDSASTWMAWGAFVFMLSDGLIAYNKFVVGGELPLAHLWIMITYYAAQGMIAWGASIEAKRY
jgi:uncharacterized membrane protein YhhN